MPGTVAGLSLALACDLRIMASNAILTTAFARVGFSGDYGGTYFLTQLVGSAKARELYFLPGKFDAAEALRIGLVNRLYSPERLREETYAYARDLADFVSPSAIATIKRQLYDVPFQTLAEATIDANREMLVALGGSDFREGVASFMEKRPPRFTGR